MTDQATLDRLIADAQADLEAARRWAATTDPHAPLAVKVKDQARIERARIELEALRELVAEATTMTPEIMTTIAASRARMLGVLERLHAERDPDCRVWEHWTIPALEGRRMAVEGCRAHDILISAR